MVKETNIKQVLQWSPVKSGQNPNHRYISSKFRQCAAFKPTLLSKLQVNSVGYVQSRFVRLNLICTRTTSKDNITFKLLTPSIIIVITESKFTVAVISGVNKSPKKFIFAYLVFSQKSYLNVWCFEKIHICIPKIQNLHTKPIFRHAFDFFMT